MYSIWILLLVFFKTPLVEPLQFDNNILKITEEFAGSNPVIIATRNEYQTKWIKNLSGRSQYFCKLSYKNLSSIEKENLIIFVDEHNINGIVEYLSILKSTVILISKEGHFNKVLSKSFLKIDQPIYFYNQDTNEVYESYTVNNYKIQRNVGKLTNNGFEWTVNSNFIKRRSDFYGLVLKAMVEWDGFDMKADTSYLTSAPFFTGIVQITSSNFKFLHIQVSYKLQKSYQFFPQKMIPFK